ncbi:HPr family phosphocarrier protein [Lederbergia wuyishanensis]|uniref:Catabolite repression HPr-like protein n=1 Tax=Lederbergia wuyishanensis TaxID=1347903 RepID=A0ABU0D8I3_9BACI|nr:HPr family phosphocarrier protein [Lederbergia wuyishanensis]MCJ8007693.1 HPr family phosphocarrier protein [Lederbergia wuyishanensis]MDQ0344723.1 catabolite repression HPr-like protein [Lederbergia wuyishanensis]
MAVKEVEVKLNTGLQARSAAQFVQEASRFSSDIFIEKDGRKVNAKSIMGLMSLAIGPSATIQLYADGNDEEEALDTLSALVQSEI